MSLSTKASLFGSTAASTFGSSSSGGSGYGGTVLGGATTSMFSGYGYGTGLLSSGSGLFGYGSTGGSGSGGGGGGSSTPASGVQGADFAINPTEDTDFSFAASDFLLSDGATASGAEITTLPTNGDLITEISTGVYSSPLVVGATLTSSSLGKLVFRPNSDFDGSDSFQVAMNDGSATDTTPSTVSISMIGTNDAPTVGSAPDIAAYENTTVAVGATLVATFDDPDASDSISSVTLVSVPAVGSLIYTDDAMGTQQTVLAGDVLSLSEAEGLSYVAPTGGITATVDYPFTFSFKDQAGQSSPTGTLTIAVSDGNDAPEVTTPAIGVAVDENETVIPGQAQVFTDPDGDTLSYSLAGDDASKFNVDSSGIVSFKSAPDADTPGDSDGGNDYDVTVIATDGSGLTAQDSFTVTVNDLANEGIPSFVNVPASISVDENLVVTGIDGLKSGAATEAATDSDGDALTYSIETWGDNGFFSINGSGQLVFNAPRDAESPGDASTDASAAGDNVYDVRLKVTDGANTATTDVAVTVANTNDNSPVISGSAATSVPENQTDTGLTYTVSDGDIGASPTIQLTPGYGDNALFSLTSSGALVFDNAPDFENPDDTSIEVSVVGDNIYDVQIMSDDGANTDTQNVAITITDADDDAPVFTPGAYWEFAEDETVGHVEAIQGGPLATDAVSPTPTYSIVSGSSAFVINPTSGALSLVGSLDHETAPTINLVIRAEDGAGNTSTGTASVVVTDENEAPTLETTPVSFAGVEEQPVYLGDLASLAATLGFDDVDGSGAFEAILASVPTAGDLYIVSGTAAAWNAGAAGALDAPVYDAANNQWEDGVGAAALTGTAAVATNVIDGSGATAKHLWFLPDEDQTGSVSFSLTLRDDTVTSANPATGPGLETTNEATINISLANAADAPDLTSTFGEADTDSTPTAYDGAGANGAVRSVDADAAVGLNLFQIVASDVDGDLNTGSWQIDFTPDDGGAGTTDHSSAFTISANGWVTYDSEIAYDNGSTLSADDDGTLTFTVSDYTGAQSFWQVEVDFI